MALYDHPATLTAMGKSPRWRRIGRWTVLVLLVLLLLAVTWRLRIGTLDSRALGASAAVIWGLINIWAFTQGQRLLLGSPMNLSAEPTNTMWRLVGLVAGVLLVIGGGSVLWWSAPR